METSLPVAPTHAAARVILKPRKALPFYGRHPWVLASAIERVEPTSVASEHLLDLDGQPVDLLNEKGRFIARGIYNSKSRIAVRLYTWSAEEAIDDSFFRRRIEAAVELRRQIGYEPAAVKGSGVNSRISESITGDSVRELIPDPLRSESACRLIFSESDGFSGLVVDRYGDYLVIQPTALGIAQRLESVVAILQDLLQPGAIVLRLDKAMAQLEGISAHAEGPRPSPLPNGEGTEVRDRTEATAASPIPFADGHVWGELPTEALVIREHGLAYEIDLHAGQKTGFYLDQRENRLAAAKYMAGRRVLDMFCYTGGFAMVAAALGGATEVLGIDGSKKAIAQARRNADLNTLKSVRFESGDAFQTLDALIEQGEKYDAVILDPPKFARGRGGANQALMAYHRLNRCAVELLQRGGILLTCSCTGGVSREDFLLMLSGVAQKSGRDIRILEQRGAAPDHPVSATCLETDYLKCMICEIR
jgi:23S rRNA (cytosine1962-C5)-methyltransferase